MENFDYDEKMHIANLLNTLSELTRDGYIQNLAALREQLETFGLLEDDDERN